MGRIVRIGTLVENVPVAIDLGMRSAGKILIKNQGSFDIRVGYDESDVSATTGVNYFTIDAGTTFIFDASPEVGFVNQVSNMFFMAVGGNSEIQVWLASV